MRSVLFDWLIEVCSVYNLHRETYHLSIAYVDQYLCRTTQLPKTKFQLLGITALFVASKIEVSIGVLNVTGGEPSFIAQEIYPPRLSDFAYVTDNTYDDEEILAMELELMNVSELFSLFPQRFYSEFIQALHWYINPITSITWLLIYLQVDCELDTFSTNECAMKKRRLSVVDSPSSMNVEVLQSSLSTRVHRSRHFLDTFFLAVQVRSRHTERHSSQRCASLSRCWICVPSIYTTLDFLNTCSPLQPFSRVSHIGLCNRSQVKHSPISPNRTSVANPV